MCNPTEGVDEIREAQQLMGRLGLPTRRGCSAIQEALDIANIDLQVLTQRRDGLLRMLRHDCTHMRLAQRNSVPPRRICMDCGAEERGWYCGYHVLFLRTENLGHGGPDVERALVIPNATDRQYYSYRLDTMYEVGQSHANFAGGGRKTYTQLTEQK